MKQKFIKDLRAWSGVHRDQLPNSIDYYFDLFILAFNKLTEKIPKDNIPARDQRSLLMHDFDNDFEQFIKTVVSMQTDQGTKLKEIGLRCSIGSLE